LAGPGKSRPALRRILETCLYVADMARARAFYEEVMGLTPHFAEERITGYRLGDSMLLLFKAGATLAPVETPGGIIPSHDGSGPAHFAFSISAAQAQAWRAHLAAHGVALESTVRWEKDRADSLYFRDPDGHLVELATPGLWGIA
jgi:catechol 2,3-dioxygenase-like lactoylglutathione lyase family enzyme